MYGRRGAATAAAVAAAAVATVFCPMGEEVEAKEQCKTLTQMGLSGLEGVKEGFVGGCREATRKTLATTKK